MDNNDLKALVNKYHAEMMKLVDEQKKSTPIKDFVNENPAAENLETIQTPPTNTTQEIQPNKDVTTPKQAEPIKNPNTTNSTPKSPIINPPIPNKPIPPEFVKFLQDNPDYGFLSIQTYESEQALPVPYTKITISKDFGDYTHIFYSATTGISGTIENLALPAPSRDLSTYPSESTKNASYDIKVYNPKFHPEEEHLHAEIFDGIKSIQLIQMDPNTKS